MCTPPSSGVFFSAKVLLLFCGRNTGTEPATVKHETGWVPPSCLHAFMLSHFTLLLQWQIDKLRYGKSHASARHRLVRKGKFYCITCSSSKFIGESVIIHSFAEQLIMSSDKLSSHRQSILLLKLSISTEDGVSRESLLEFDFSEIDEFLRCLVDARKVAMTLMNLVVICNWAKHFHAHILFRYLF